jgi:hypothetical protein
MIGRIAQGSCVVEVAIARIHPVWMPRLIVPRSFAAVRRLRELQLAATTEWRGAAHSASVWRDPSWRPRLNLHQQGLFRQQKGHHLSLGAAGVRVLSWQVSLLQLVSLLLPSLRRA